MYDILLYITCVGTRHISAMKYKLLEGGHCYN